MIMIMMKNCSFLSVGLAKLIFPMEAKVAMDIAQVDGTSEFTLTAIRPRNLADTQRKTVDLNDAPFRIKEEYLNRLRALSKTGNELLMFYISCSLSYLFCLKLYPATTNGDVLLEL